MWWGLYLPVYLTMFFIIGSISSPTTGPPRRPSTTISPSAEWFVFPYDSWSFLLVAIGVT